MEDPGTDLRLSVENVGLTDTDIYDAMKSIPGYLDITPGDFKELYCHAYRKALDLGYLYVLMPVAAGAAIMLSA